nr:reverse transcriptase domain-containing protein [Tanacetum cinerariifolium]
MPPNRNNNIYDVYERIMARMEERLDQFVDQFANRMNDMMNPRRRGDRNEWEDDRVVDDDYEEGLVFDDDPYEEEIVNGDVDELEMGDDVFVLIGEEVAEDCASESMRSCVDNSEYILVCTAALTTYFLLRRCLKANKRVKVYYECMEPFKSLMRLWVRSKSIAAIWLEKVVTPLIDPAIKGFATVSAVLKLERLKVDKHGMSEPMSYYLID